MSLSTVLIVTMAVVAVIALLLIIRQAYHSYHKWKSKNANKNNKKLATNASAGPNVKQKKGQPPGSDLKGNQDGGELVSRMGNENEGRKLEDDQVGRPLYGEGRKNNGEERKRIRWNWNETKEERKRRQGTQVDGHSDDEYSDDDLAYALGTHPQSLNRFLAAQLGRSSLSPAQIAMLAKAYAPTDSSRGENTDSPQQLLSIELQKLQLTPTQIEALTRAEGYFRSVKIKNGGNTKTGNAAVGGARHTQTRIQSGATPQRETDMTKEPKSRVIRSELPAGTRSLKS